MQTQQAVDNNKFANLILSKKMATREQIGELWPYLTPSKDIGRLLVERGLLPEVIYGKMVDFIINNIPANPPQSSPQLKTAPPPARPECGSPARQVRPSNEKRNTRDAPPLPQKAGDKIAVSSTITVATTLPEMLKFAREINASDLHLSVNNPVLARRYGILTRLSEDALTAELTNRHIRSILSDRQYESFDGNGDLEFIYSLPDAGRFRVTVMKQRYGGDLTARCIPRRIRTFEETGMPQSCRTLTEWAQGLVLVTGPASCGKTSTLTTLVEMINQTRNEHIITMESPIEYLYTPARAQITQREIGRDTVNQEAALRAALREDPDIIVVGELRDLATIQLAVSAAETGHLVFATMNTISASRTIYRLIDSFPPEEQGIIRNMVSESLRGVISQQLIPRMDGTGMVAAYEVLLVNTAVANMIRKDEAHQLGTAMITGRASGMQLLDDSLRSLAGQGIISQEEVAARCFIRPPGNDK